MGHFGDVSFQSITCDRRSIPIGLQFDHDAKTTDLPVYQPMVAVLRPK